MSFVKKRRFYLYVNKASIELNFLAESEKRTMTMSRYVDEKKEEKKNPVDLFGCNNIHVFGLFNMRRSIEMT